MGLLSKQEPIKPKYTSLKNEDLTVGEGFEAAGQFAMDALEGVSAPFRMAGHTYEDLVTGVPAEQMKANRADEREKLDYKPTNKLAQEMSKTGQEAIGKGVAAITGFLKDPDNAWMFGYMPEGIDSVQKLWGMIPERGRISIGAGADVAEVLLAGGAFNTVKQGYKLSQADIFPELKNTHTVATATATATKPALLTSSSKRLTQLEPAALAATVDDIGFTSGIEEAIVRFTNSGQLRNFTAAQLLAKLKKDNSGVKKDEIEWSTFSDFLEEKGNAKMTASEALQEAKDRSISLEVIEDKSGEGKWGKNPYGNMEGGSNYRELKFVFNLDPQGIRPKVEAAAKKSLIAGKKYTNLERADIDYQEDIYARNRDANYWDKTGENFWAASSQHEGLRKDLQNSATPYASKIVDAKRDADAARDEYTNIAKTMPRTFTAGHMPEPDIIFYTRIRDRTVGGTHSLAIDEIQSDWHQGVDSKSYGYDLGPEEVSKKADKDELRLIAELEALEAEKAVLKAEYDASKVSERTYMADNVPPPKDVVKKRRGLQLQVRELKKKINKTTRKMLNVLDVQEVIKEGTYNANSRRMFIPNAPLKNEAKWLGAAFNAMTYKAVKEGYESIAWPKGDMQVKLYSKVSPEAHAALRKMYDTTIPKILEKTLKKMDKSAVIERGKASDFYHIKLTPKMKEVIRKGQPLFLAEGGLVSGYKHGGLVDNEMEALNLHSGGDAGHTHPKADAPEQIEQIQWGKDDTLSKASRLTGIPVDTLAEWHGGIDKIVPEGGTLDIPADYYTSIERMPDLTPEELIKYTEDPVVPPKVLTESTPSPTITEAEKPPVVTPAPVPAASISNRETVSLGTLWGRAYHTEAETDAVMLADYASDVAAYVKPNSAYVNLVSPILDTVIAAFLGDEGTDPVKLHRAMLEIGAHESEGGSQLHNSDSGASGVFQVLASTVLSTATTSPYYGPKAQALAGKTPAQVAAMTKAQRETWMQTDLTANAVFGTIELIKLSKGLANGGDSKYLNTLQTRVDKTNWAEILP